MLIYAHLYIFYCLDNIKMPDLMQLFNFSHILK